MIGNVCLSEFHEAPARGVLQGLLAERFGIRIVIAGSDRKQHGHRVRGVNVNGLFCGRYAASLGEDLGTDLKRDAIMAAAVQVLVAVAIEHQGVVAGGVDGARDAGLTEAQAKADFARLAAGKSDRKHAIRVSCEELPGEESAAAAEANAREGCVQVQRAAIRSAGSVERIEGITATPEVANWCRSSSSGPGDTSQQSDWASSYLSCEKKLANLLQVRQRLRIDLAGGRCPGPRCGFRERDALHLRTAEDHAPEAAIADRQCLHPSFRGAGVPKFVVATPRRLSPAMRG